MTRLLLALPNPTMVGIRSILPRVKKKPDDSPKTIILLEKRREKIGASPDTANVHAPLNSTSAVAASHWSGSPGARGLSARSLTGAHL